MTLVAQIRFGLAHSTWAIEQIIDHAKRLPGERLEEDLGIGPGGLRVNLAHTIETIFFFADNFADRPYVERPDFAELSGSLEGLHRLLAAASQELFNAMVSACERGLSPQIPWPSAAGGSLSAVAAVAQVFDHATLHRTQCINMLKRLGVRPVPDLDPMTFQSTGLPW